MPGLTQAARGLDPAEWLLDPLALVLAHRIAGMAGGAATIAKQRLTVICATRGTQPAPPQSATNAAVS